MSITPNYFLFMYLNRYLLAGMRIKENAAFKGGSIVFLRFQCLYFLWYIGFIIKLRL